MSPSPEEKLPHHALFHRALLALILAGGFALGAYKAGYPWYLVLPALASLAAGIWYLKRGSDRWNETQR
ncbi:MAG TPA: hypothetical protein VKE95_07095 [Burkholderiales bacterium]|nr:hypothetical protein [Burkholderiales bacterium]